MRTPTNLPNYCSCTVFMSLLVASCVGGIDAAGGDQAGNGAPGKSGTPAGAGGASARTPPGPGSAPTAGPGGVVAGAKPAGQPRAGTKPMRRLSRVEYSNTLRDLLGADGEPGNDFATDANGQSGFAEGALVAGAELDRMYDTIDRLARAAMTTKWAQLVACDPAKTGEEPCADEFIKTMGRRAYRHALSAEETRDLKAVYSDARKVLGWDFKNGIRTTLAAMLLSPRFHYRWELGDRVPRVQGGLVVLDPFQVASELSYFLWQSMPDDALLDAADKGDLLRPEAVLAHARRLLGDGTRGGRGLRGFFHDWLDLEALDTRDVAMPADPKLGLGAGVFAAMSDETNQFVVDLVLGQGDRRFGTLLSAGHSFINESLAKLYGITGVKGNELRKVNLDATQRSGVVTHASFLTATAGSVLSTPIRRGRFLFERLATCQAVPSPEGTIPDPPPARDGASVRDQLSEHSANGVCKGCHMYMDPIGFAFGSYDQLGRFRTMDERGRPIDATGTLPGLASGPLSFNGAVDLAKKLAGTPETQKCFARQLYRFALRKAVGPDDETSADAMADLFVRSGLDLRELLVAATQTFSFYNRAPAKGEVLQ